MKLAWIVIVGLLAACGDSPHCVEWTGLKDVKKGIQPVCKKWSNE